MQLLIMIDTREPTPAGGQANLNEVKQKSKRQEIPKPRRAKVLKESRQHPHASQKNIQDINLERMRVIISDTEPIRECSTASQRLTTTRQGYIGSD